MPLDLTYPPIVFNIFAPENELVGILINSFPFRIRPIFLGAKLLLVSGRVSDTSKKNGAIHFFGAGLFNSARLFPSNFFCEVETLRFEATFVSRNFLMDALGGGIFRMVEVKNMHKKSMWFELS